MRTETFGRATLIHADWRDVEPCSGVVVTDPPYGISATTNWDKRTEWHNYRLHDDHDTSSRDDALAAFDAPFACFGSWKMPAPPGTRGALVWDKGPSSGMGDLSFPWKGSFDLIFVGGQGWNGQRDGGVLAFTSVSRQSMGRIHPNEKPTALLAHLIAKAPPGRIIDPFLGSGSTGVAALDLGREFLGVEIDAHWFDVACRRLDHAARQGRLFA